MKEARGREINDDSVDKLTNLERWLGEGTLFPCSLQG